MQVHWRIRLPVALSVDTSFTFPSRQKSARSTDRHLLARFQSPFLIASVMVTTLALWDSFLVEEYLTYTADNLP